MAGSNDPITYPSNWDYVVLAGVTSPLCEVDGFEREYKWQVKTGKGVKGATETFIGVEPAKGTIKLMLWRPADFVLDDQIVALLKYDPTKQNGQAADIAFPSLADIDVVSVVATKIGQIKHDGEGLYSRTIELLEYFPASTTAAVSTPNGAAAGVNGILSNPHVGGQVPPTVESQLNNQIAGLLAQAGQP